MLSPMSRRIVLLQVEPGGANDVHAGTLRDARQLRGISTSAAGHRIDQCFPARAAKLENFGARFFDRVQKKVGVAKSGEARVDNNVLVRVADSRCVSLNVAGHGSEKRHSATPNLRWRPSLEGAARAQQHRVLVGSV